MYHIKDDKRVEKSSELLYQGLLRCLNQKDFADITVSDISKASTVGRATFYRNFDSIADILSWKCNQQVSEMLHGYIEQHIHSDRKLDFLLHVFRYWTIHLEVLECLLRINRIDIIYKSFMDNSHIIMDYLKDQIKLPDFHYDYFMSTRIGIFIGIMDTWMKNGKSESAEEITEIIEKQLLFAQKSTLIF
ncbi:TetR/AcrR family transcriptional regulator [Faecalicatena orotica]|nr:TetR/AcrR family transcriptional regulator [Faecalicatena orotica]